MTQPNLSDSFTPALSDSEQPPFQQSETPIPSERLTLINQSALQENEVIRVELYAEMPLFHRQTVVRENLPIEHYLADQTTD